MKTNSYTALAAAVALALSSLAFAAPMVREASFVKKAAQGGMAEVELSNLAATNSSSSEVKKFATAMVTAHTENNAKLASIARGEGLDVPTSLDSEHAMLKAKLAALKGADFDKQYGDAMGKDHTAMLKLLDDNAKVIEDPKLKAFIGDTRPVVADHLKMAGSLSGG